MKVITPEISWHERDPVYSVDFQPGNQSVKRIASGGVDRIVRIWQFSLDPEGKGQVDFLSNLRRHTAAVNVVRFSWNGELLATGGDDSSIILWKLSDLPASANIFADDDNEEDKESWVCHKSLRGHLRDVADLSWSRDSKYLLSGSVDNCAIVWDAVKGTKLALFDDHKSYVQGVAFDPLGNYIATLSADRSLRLFNLNSKNCVHNVSKMTLPSQSNPAATQDTTNAPSGTKPKPFRIFHDDSLRSFFRRMEFSPDGQLLVTPAGCMEVGDSKVLSVSFIFARGAFAKPAVYLPSSEKATTVIRMNPQLFQLRPADLSSSQDITSAPIVDNCKEWEKNKSVFCLPYRMVFAVATDDSVILYDTQQTMPIGLLKNIHYHQISDLSWSGDGKALIISSTDGFCTITTFEDNELGTPYQKNSSESEMDCTDSMTPSLMKDPALSVETSPEKGPDVALQPVLQNENRTKPTDAGTENKNISKKTDSKDKAAENSSSGSKKKRIQLTTLSLMSKK